MGHPFEDDCTRAALLMDKLNNQRTQAQFCDCVIRKGQGAVYPVHRCILAASSPVFASILYSSGVLVELEAPCLSDCILGHLLDYIYTGTLPHLDYKLYFHLFVAAQYLKMDELQHTIRTKAAEATRFALLPSRMDCYKSPSEAPLHCLSESKNSQGDILETQLALAGENKYIHWSDRVSMKRKPDNNNCDHFETEQTSRCIGSSGEKQQLSTMCQDWKPIGAIKPETWHGNKEEVARSHPSVSTEVQENEQTQVERTQDLCKHGKVTADEMQSNSGEDTNYNSSCCSTSVIRHSSRVTRVDKENVAMKRPHDTEPCTDQTGQTLTERTFCATAEDNQDLENKPAYQYVTHNMCSVDMLKNNDLLDIHFSEKDSKKIKQYGPDNRCRKNSQMKDIPRISTKNSTCNSPVDNVAVALTDEISDTRIKFQDKGICVKRKPKEKNSEKCYKSAKTDLACSASAETETNTESVYNNEGTRLESTDTPTTKLYRRLSVPPKGNTCKPAYTDPSYSGQLFYHCESRTSHIPFSPNFSPTFSDTSSEDNNVSIFTTLTQKETFGEGEIVLLDISSKSPEMSVPYKCTSEMGTHAADAIDKTKMDQDKSQNSESEHQEGNERHIASSHEEGANILTRCTSGCAHNSTVSTSMSDLTPSPCMQTKISDLSSPVHRAFRCSLCERSFSQRGSLNRHVRSHLGVRPFPCPQCPMSFSRQYRVVEHMRVHQRSDLGTDFPKTPASSV